MAEMDEAMAPWNSADWPPPETVKCGDCTHFVRDGKCNWYSSDDAKIKDRPFGSYEPFWVWSDCYSDKEQVRADVTSACSAFAALRPALEGEKT